MTPIKKALTPLLAISLAIALLALYENKPTTHTSEQRSATTAAGNTISGKLQSRDDERVRSRISANHETTAENEKISGVTIVILNTGKKLPLAFKLGGQFIKVPGPSAWPPIGHQGIADAEKDRYLAAIIDTADVLRANGFKADEAFDLVVGGIELNAGNTFRIKGNHQSILGKDDSDPSVEYHTQAGEQGIWRSLQFKNIVLSHAQNPSLEDHLVLSQRSEDVDELTTAHGEPPALTAKPMNVTNIAQVTPLEDVTPESTRKNVEDLNNPDPEVRASAIQNLILDGYREANPNFDNNAKMAAIISNSLLDNNPIVRTTTLNSLDAYEGNIPQTTLSHMALNDSNPGLRIQALDLLVERFGQQASATLIEAQHDPDSRVARMADQLLSEITDQSQP